MQSMKSYKGWTEMNSQSILNPDKRWIKKVKENVPKLEKKAVLKYSQAKC